MCSVCRRSNRGYSLSDPPYVGFVAASTELRARSALDIALWDVLGKITVNQYRFCWAVEYVAISRFTTRALVTNMYVEPSWALLRILVLNLREQTRITKTWTDSLMIRLDSPGVFSIWELTQ
ncbi:MAG: hypothetical protein CM1200mP18_17060 [Gammaproteobacteria bacterium]|nr:MAG: hypothetical protein CM1200mP18_17060 [Gammaproteobacteria bacterium]